MSSGFCFAHSSAWLLFSDDSVVTSFAILAQHSAAGFTSRALVQTEVGNDDISEMYNRHSIPSERLENLRDLFRIF